jgi:hypothetical protein
MHRTRISAFVANLKRFMEDSLEIGGLVSNREAGRPTTPKEDPVADEFEKTSVSANEEADADVEAHKNALQKNALQKDEADDDNDVEAHKNALQKTAIQ